MNAILKHALLVGGLVVATQAAAQVTFYEHPGFRGESFTTDRQIGNLERFGFNNRASSAIVRGGAWEVCDAPAFGGRCVLLRPGEYPSLGAMGLNDSVSSVRTEADRTARVEPPVAPGPAQITLYGRENFQGRSVTADRPIGDLERVDFADRASSAVVQGSAWEVCDDARFGGRCVILRPGRYPSLAEMGLDNRISSLRLAGAAPAPAPGPAAGQITLYGRENFEGRSLTADRPIGDLERVDFADRASSAVVQGTAWEVCDDARFGGRCVILRPGRYPSLAEMGLDNRISSLRLAGTAPVPAPGPAPGQITFYGRENFEGRSITVDRPIGDLERLGFSDRASSLVVSGTPWEVCDNVGFNGRCTVLRPGRYPSLAMIGLNDRISSVRAARE
jgi:beta/gamma crystallin